jgi:hypothetical protein
MGSWPGVPRSPGPACRGAVRVLRAETAINLSLNHALLSRKDHWPCRFVPLSSRHVRPTRRGGGAPAPHRAPQGYGAMRECGS